MRPLALGLLGYAMVVLEGTLRPALALGSTGVMPHFVIILVAFVAMNGQGLGVYWTALALGVAVDLTTVLPAPPESGPGAAAMLGPHAVAYVLAAFFVVAIRGVMMRRSPFALPFLSMVGAALSGLGVVFLVMIRSWFDPQLLYFMWSSLGAEIGSALYTAMAAFVLGPVLRALAGALGLDDAGARRFSR